MPSTTVTLTVNGRSHELEVEPGTPLLYVLRNDLGLKGPKFGCGLEQCGACKVLVAGQAVPSCRLPVKNVLGLPVVTVEGLGTAGQLHPLQEAFIEEQAIQCGYCAAGMIVAAQGLLNRTRYPTDEEIRRALADNLCRCGVYDRVRRAIKRRIGRPDDSSVYEVRTVLTETAAADADLDMPRALQQTPELDAWVRINRDDTITLFTGKVEYGQGLETAIAQIGAEELDVSITRIRVAMADTDQTPDEGITAGSMSLETTGNAIRWAAAEARQRLLAIAFEELEAPLERLVVNDGVISDPATGRSITYWQLHSGRQFGCRVTGSVLPKRPQAYTVVGQPTTRLDLPAKVSGVPTFVHDIDLTGMLHGRVVRPPHADARLVSADSATVAQMPSVLKVIQEGTFLAVIAEREEQAIAAMEALRQSAVWTGEAALPAPEILYEALFSQPDQPFLLLDGSVVDEPIPPFNTPAEAVQTLTALYSRPYQMHASLGPSAAVALLAEGKMTLWVQTQGVFPIRAAIAPVLGIDEADIHVVYCQGAGCYGHNGADDAALDAALLAQAMPGHPVSLKWMRADEHGWEPYAPAMQVKLQASLGAGGTVIDWNHDVLSPSHFGRPRPGEGVSGLLAAWHLEAPFDRPRTVPSRGRHSGSHRNADPLYAFPRRRVVKRHLPRTPLRVSTMRSLGAFANVFAIESFMDELAQAAGDDPIAFRLRHLTDARARAVIKAAADKAGWQARRHPRADGRGWGIAFAQYKNRQTYAAVIVEVSVDTGSGRIRLERVVIGADAGRVVNPDGLSNQLEGGFVQSASQTLYEQVLWNEQGIVSLDWESYPILRFPEAPRIETVLLNRPDQPHVGAGEAAQGPTPAAIANAVFDATGIRLRDIPFTPERVKRAWQAQ